MLTKVSLFFIIFLNYEFSERQLMKRIFYFSVFSLLLFASCRTTKADVTQAFSEQSEYTKAVETLYGPVAGIINESEGFELFAGIPFAKAPVNELRWKEPQDMEAWDGIFYADHFAPLAMQPRNSKIFRKLFNAYTHSDGDRTDFAPMSEDCLYLNIWRPLDSDEQSSRGSSRGDKLPVLVYVHGGSLMSGSSWFEAYDGANLCKQGIIVVTIAYRTGIFGYFAHEELAAESPNGTTGNYGLLDQIKALEWVHNNIEFFGGDASNITIAGESAGSSSVNALCASPLTKGLFRRAIAESSSLVVQVPSHTFRSTEDALKMGHKIMKEFKCENISELRALPAEKLIKTKHSNNAMTVDPYAMPEYPWEIYQKNQNHEEALLNGFNAREGFAFTFFSKINKKNYRQLLSESPYLVNIDELVNYTNPQTNKEAKKIYTDIFSVICFTYPHYSWSKVLTAQGKPVYEYYFSKENGGIGTNHSGEMIYAYKNVPRNSAYDEKDYKLEEIMSTYWVNFVKYGDPNGAAEDVNGGSLKSGAENGPSSAAPLGLPQWQTVGQSGGLLLELGEEVYMREDPFMGFYKFVNFDIDKQKRPPTYGKKEE